MARQASNSLKLNLINHWFRLQHPCPKILTELKCLVQKWNTKFTQIISIIYSLLTFNLLNFITSFFVIISIKLPMFDFIFPPNKIQKVEFHGSVSRFFNDTMQIYIIYRELTFCKFCHFFSSPQNPGSHNSLFDFFLFPVYQTL